MHGSSQREMPWQNTVPGLLFSWPGVSRSCFCSADRRSRPSRTSKVPGFSRILFRRRDKKLIPGHDFLPVEKVLLKRILAVRPDSVNCPSRKTSPKTKELEMRLISSPLTSQLADGNFANEVTKRAGRSATLMTPLYEPQTSPESLIQRELDQ